MVFILKGYKKIGSYGLTLAVMYSSVTMTVNDSHGQFYPWRHILGVEDRSAEILTEEHGETIRRQVL